MNYEEFYPTPRTVIDKMLIGLDVNNKTILGMRTNLTNINKPMMKHKVAITYSTCCISVKKGFYVQK